MDTIQTLRPGATLRQGTYRIERVLGRGGFGITYLATDLTLYKTVAVKEFFSDVYCARDSDTSRVSVTKSTNAGLVAKLKSKFLKEARSIATLDSTGIIRVLAAFEENDTAYYVMDYIEGLNLSELVKREGPLPADRALHYIRKVGEALEFVHSRKMMHLDVKPANIMVRAKDDMPMLIDFGLSKHYDHEGHQTSTTPTGISHGFAPIEQYYDEVSEFSPQTDLYSLAATLYYLLSGVVPPPSTKLAVESLPFPSSIPSNLVAPISKAMSPSKAGRHGSIREFVNDLLVAKSESRVNATVVEDTEARPWSGHAPYKESASSANERESRTTFTGTKRTIPKWLIVIAMLIIAGGIGWLIFPKGDRGSEMFSKGKAAFDRGDYPEAFDWFSKAADEGNAEAQFQLGIMYDNGDGVAKDNARAVSWYRKSADQGYDVAQYHLGGMYEYGRGVAKDSAESLTWYRKAANQGNAQAQWYLGSRFYTGYDYGEAQDYSEIARSYRKAADQGDLWAQYNLGEMYEHGVGVAKNYSQALSWYRKAAEQGYVWAQERLGDMYFDGQGVTRDYLQSMSWYLKAADQGDARAQNQLGKMHEYGAGVAKDYSQAVNWYRKAAGQGYADAQEHLKVLGETY